MAATTLRFVDAARPEHTPSFLSLDIDGRRYRFVILHATLEESRPARAERGRPHAHDLYHVVLFTRGESAFMLEGAARPCRAGTLVCTGPGQPHDFGSTDGRALAYRELTFALEGPDGSPATIPFEDVLSAYAGLRVCPVEFGIDTDARQRAWLEEFFHRTLEALALRRDWLGAHVACVELVAFLVREFFAGRGRGAREQTAGVARAREIVELRYRERVTVDELAREAHLSPGYLIRAYKAQHGRSPIAHLLSLRVAAAANLLRSTSLSCKEIADSVGFGDIHQFSRTFSKSQGISPIAYRRRSRGA